MPFIASSAPGSKRIVMAARKSSTLGHQEQTYSTKKRASGIIEMGVECSYYVLLDWLEWIMTPFDQVQPGRRL